MIRLPIRRAIKSFVPSRNYSSNNGKKKSNSNEREENGDPCLVVKKIAQSTGILSTIFLIGFQTNLTDCSLKKNNYNSLSSFLLNSPFLSFINEQLISISHNCIFDSQKPGSSNQKTKIILSNISIKENIDKISNMMKIEVDKYFQEYQNIRAVALLENNNTEQAIKLLKRCTSSSKAMFNLGLLYETGKHDSSKSEPNYQNALKYYTIAVSLGHTLAHYNLGLIYLYGKGKTQVDQIKGYDLIKKAAHLGVEEAQSFLKYSNFELSKKSKKSLNHHQINNSIVNKSFFNTSPTPKLTSFIKYIQPKREEACAKLLNQNDFLLQ